MPRIRPKWIGALALAVLSACKAFAPEKDLPGAEWKTAVSEHSFTGRYAAGEGVVVAETSVGGSLANHELIAFAADTGTELWRRDVGGTDDVLTPLVVSGARVLYGYPAGDGTASVFALDLHSGKELWRHPGITTYLDVQLVATGSTVAVASTYLAEQRGGLVYLDAATGSEMKTIDLAGREAQLASDGHTIVALGEDGDLAAVTVTWTVSTGLARGELSVRDDTAVVVTGATTHTYDLRSGESLAEFDGVPFGGLFTNGTGFEPGDVIAFDLRSGDESWRVAAAAAGGTRVVGVSDVVGDLVAVLTDTTVAMVNAKDGSIRSMTKLESKNGYGAEAVFLTAKTCYVREEKDHEFQPSEFALSAFEVDNGKRKWRSESHGDLHSAVLEGKLITEQLGTLVALP